MSNLAYIGLGVMGFPMAGHLAKAGHTVTVYNRSSDKTKKWSSIYGGKTAQTPADAAEGEQWWDYQAGANIGWKLSKSIGIFAEGEYTKMWDSEFFITTFGINYTFR